MPIFSIPDGDGPDGSHAWLASVLEASADAVYMVDRSRTVVAWNRGAERLFGLRAPEAVGTPHDGLFPPHWQADGVELLTRALAGETIEQHEAEVLGRDGQVVPVSMTLRPVREPGGGIDGVTAVVRDVTEQRLALATLAESEAKLLEAQSLAHVGIWVWDSIHATVQWSEELYRIHAVNPRDFTGTYREYLTLVALEDRDRVDDAFRRAARQGTALEIEYQIVRPGGGRRWVYTRADPVAAAGPAIVGLRGICQDITDRKRAEEELSRLARHDPLTGLPNRALFLDRLSQALARLNRTPGLLAVLFMDLDGFKMINDSLGHEAGDELLTVLAERLQGVVRPSDTVARFGGDEFTVLCEALARPDEALAIARRLADAAAAPLALSAGHDAELTASVGVAFSRGEGTPEGLLRDADVAMYRAKEQGPDRCEIFDVALRQRATERLATIQALRAALDRDEFRLVYQPQVDLRDGRIVGVEALVRWQHPERGLLGPAQFIPLAEESQLIVPIGDWVIAEACRQAARWRAEGAAPLKVSINVSARQLAYGDLAESIATALTATATPAGTVCLEITENVLMSDADFYLEALLGLRFLGVSLAVDDFGRGYSSLAYLQRFPLDILKVDKAFVDGLGNGDARARAIPRAVINLARDIGLTVVAEGVETAGQARDLVDLGCAYAQGYHFARPEPPEAITARLLAGADGPPP
ncbi:MAG TPA: EAL domain-containing protein [Acidimicrobiia bacterium]|nr:EAL domain-containing protein [Acidimicrobiia bacterium]